MSFKKHTARKKKERKKKEVKLKRAVMTKSVDVQEEEESICASKKGRFASLLRGMKDILPRESVYWIKMHHVAEGISEAYGFVYTETPILEDAALFVRSLGRGTDVVDKEMYIFEDHDGSRVCLRPEATASLARAYIYHGMHTYPQPVKMWYYGPMFRHDRPQAGRYREFHQFGCENFGVHDPVVDAELIVVAYNFLRDLGIKSVVHVNSIGTAEDRQNYLIELTGYLRTKRGYLCEDCKKRIMKNPLRVLDCKNEQCQPIIEEAPQILDWLSTGSKSFFTKVLEYLDEADVPYILRSTLVRGLDYYTETVFELYPEETGEEGAQSALGGGGRYDLLVEQVGGQPTPGCGFAIGLERVVAILRHDAEKQAQENKDERVGLDHHVVYFAHLGEQARQRALKIIENLRRAGVRLHHNLGKSALKAQLEQANKLRAANTLILGQKEVQDGTIIIRDMESGIQEIVDIKKLKNALEKKMSVEN